MPRRLVIILGPTAVGKTEFSVRKALEYGSPIISCDVTQAYTAGDYERDALSLIDTLFEEGHDTLVMTGGSMFYIDAVCEGLDDLPDGDPQLRKALWERVDSEGLESLLKELETKDPLTYSRIDKKNSQRVVRALEVCLVSGRPLSLFKSGGKKRDFEIEKIGLTRPREELYSRIDKRVLSMIDAGLEDEVRSLLPYRDLQALQTVGYKEMFDYLDRKIPLEEAVRLIQRNTRHYAKKQMTWWRRDSTVHWTELVDR